MTLAHDARLERDSRGPQRRVNPQLLIEALFLTRRATQTNRSGTREERSRFDGMQLIETAPDTMDPLGGQAMRDERLLGHFRRGMNERRWFELLAQPPVAPCS